jgi:beta-glucosidase
MRLSRLPQFTSLLALFVIVFLFSTADCAQESAPANASYKNPHLSPEQRLADLLKRMTLEEKATMLSGSGWMESASIPRLGIPAIKMADGPMGVRSWLGSSALTSAAHANATIETTAFPSAIAMASTWDTDLVQREGRSRRKSRHSAAT